MTPKEIRRKCKALTDRLAANKAEHDVIRRGLVALQADCRHANVKEWGEDGYETPGFVRHWWECTDCHLTRTTVRRALNAPRP